MATQNLEAVLTELETLNRELKNQATRLEDVQKITNLQSRYNLWLGLGYYGRIWEELFSHSRQVKCEIGESGVYEGPESVKRLWIALANRKRERGYMDNTGLHNPYIVVNKDNKTAKGMWWAFGPHTDYATPFPADQRKLTAYWFFGKIDNEFIKEDGQWKILSLHMIVYIRTPFNRGWYIEPDCVRWEVPEGAPPDKPPTLFNTYHGARDNTWEPHPYPYQSVMGETDK